MENISNKTQQESEAMNVENICWNLNFKCIYLFKRDYLMRKHFKMR